jgi:hypothetical protein
MNDNTIFNGQHTPAGFTGRTVTSARAEMTQAGRNESALVGTSPATHSSAAHIAAIATVEAAIADDFLLREVKARTGELLESRQKIERAKRALADARAALIQGAWTDGTLADEADLAEAVSGLLASA